MPDDYTAENRASWDERVPAHVDSPDYAVEALIADPTRLSGVVAFDAEALGDLDGLDAVHLQCHIGTDTVSLARLGARVTGLDFSAPAIEAARTLAARAGVPDAEFVVSDVYDAPSALGGRRFDLVYTGVGALCWLPDIDRWAETVAACLRPGGRLFVREGHPVLWALDDGRDDALLTLRYPYFSHDEPFTVDDPGTYVATETTFTHTRSHSWNHGLGEVVTALLAVGLRIERFEEHRFLDWRPWAIFEEDPDRPGTYRLPVGLRDVAPLQYTIVARSADV